MDRFNQMSGQASLIAKKKAEIQAKRKAQEEAAQNSGSVSVYNQLAGSSGAAGTGNLHSTTRGQKALPTGNLKNRWGLKGKSYGSQRPAPTSAAVCSNVPSSNTFSNDGSFLDKFKKMQQDQEGTKQMHSKSDETKRGFGNLGQDNAQTNSRQQVYSKSTRDNSSQDLLSTPPPPPPKTELKAYSSSESDQSTGSINKPEADEWYKQALERARNIAKNIGQPAKTPVVPPSDALYPKSTPNLFPPQEVMQGRQPDFSIPPPPVPLNYMHQPPPSMKIECGQAASQLGFDQKVELDAEYGGDTEKTSGSTDGSGSKPYSPTKPTTTPTKVDQICPEMVNKVLPAECKYPPPPPVISSPGVLKRDGQEEMDDLKDVVLSTVAEELASMVACSGDQLENVARNFNQGMDEAEMSFLYDTTNKIYRKYRQRIDSLRKGMILESDARQKEAEEKAIDEIAGTSESLDDNATRKRKRRWGDENDKVQLDAPVLLPTPGILPSGPLTRVGKSNPELVQYAIRVFGSTDLTETQWKQCEDQIKMSMVYNEMLVKKKQAEIMAQKGQNKYQYDSDEDIEGGTWEHKARKVEMEKTLSKAEKQTEAGKGMHHIGDFLPPQELTKFMNKFKALQNGESYDESDYVENKLTDENLGFKMLARMGWSEGKGLGQDGQGITAPVGKSGTGADKKGVGVSEVHNLEQGDDEFEAYRKRMMMAYRFRPNPLNNPRRAYY